MDPSISSLNDSRNINQTNPNNSSIFYGEEQNSSGLYDSAVENLTNGTTFNSLNESLFYDLPNYGTGSSNTSVLTAATDDSTPNKNSSLTFVNSEKSDNITNNSSIDGINMNMNDVPTNPPGPSTTAKSLNYGNGNQTTTAAMNASALFIQSESTDTNTSSLDEVDPKSQLANKTIFKSDNPNLSIIEINDNSPKEQDLKHAVVLIESLSEDYDTIDADAVQTLAADNKSDVDDVKKHITNTTPNQPMAEDKTTNSNMPPTTQGEQSESAADKRRKRAESLLHSSKQKLDLAIAEASAAAETNDSADGKQSTSTTLVQSNGDVHPETKREIKVYDTIEEFEENLPSTVTLLDTPFGSRVYLVGTAHFSEESQDDVSFVIRNVRPDVVMVELCPSRIHILKLDEKTLLEEAKSFNLAKIRGILHAHGYINGIFFILLLQMSAQIAKDLGMAPGGEFRRAFEEIHRLPGCMLHLGDRPIRITLHRALRALSLWQTLKLVWRLTSTDTISIEEVEECKQRDLLEKLMQEMAGEFPAFSDVFVKERDLFLCHSLQLAALPQTPPGSVIPRPVRVVGVVGIGHAKGIAQMWGRVDPQKIPEIMNIPPASLSTRIAKYTVKYGLIGLTLYGAFKILRPRFAGIY